MTTDERKAAAALIDIVRNTRNGLEMAAAIDKACVSDDDLTFLMDQAMIVAGDLVVALARCREANRAAHKLIK